MTMEDWWGTMRRIVTLLVLMLLLCMIAVFGVECTNLPPPTNCKYKVAAQCTQNRNVFYENGVKLETDILEVHDAITYNNRYSFSIHNYWNESISLTFYYLLNGQQYPAERTIPSEGSVFIDDAIPNQGSLDNDSIRFVILSPLYLESKWEPILAYNIEICRECPSGSGNLCKNPGEAATSDDQCGSGRRNVAGICMCDEDEDDDTCPTCYVVGDGTCHNRSYPSGKCREENCGNSPGDCACDANHICVSNECRANCSNPPEGYVCPDNASIFVKYRSKSKGQICNYNEECQEWYVCEENACVLGPNCPSESLKCDITDSCAVPNIKEDNQPCGCDFECVEHYMCVDKLCKCKPTDPPDGSYYCSETKNCRTIKAIGLGMHCECDNDCMEGVCFQGICQNLLNPKLKCPSGTNVKKGDMLLCNIYAANPKIGEDIRVTFILEAGSGLSFADSQGCQNIKGSQCISTVTVSDLSNEGISVGLNANSCGNSTIYGSVTYNYNGRSVTEPVQADFPYIHVYCCGDGIIDPGETKQNCCCDVGVKDYGFFNVCNEKCSSGSNCNNESYSCPLNWPFIVLVTILVGGILALGAILIIRELTKLSGAEQKKIATEIERINHKIKEKEQDIEVDRKRIEKLKKEKALAKELGELYKEKEEQHREREEQLRAAEKRIRERVESIKGLYEEEHTEKEKLREDRLRPFLNKQDKPVIINENGYEQFPHSLHNPDNAGELFHRWFAKKEIYKKNPDKYPLSWRMYEVHHLDGNRRNNTLSNLQILTKEEHDKLHGRVQNTL
jgi:hypothetical protein